MPRLRKPASSSAAAQARPSATKRPTKPPSPKPTATTASTPTAPLPNKPFSCFNHCPASPKPADDGLSKAPATAGPEFSRESTPEQHTHDADIPSQEHSQEVEEEEEEEHELTEKQIFAEELASPSTFFVRQATEEPLLVREFAQEPVPATEPSVAILEVEQLAPDACPPEYSGRRRLSRRPTTQASIARVISTTFVEYNFNNGLPDADFPPPPAEMIIATNVFRGTFTERCDLERNPPTGEMQVSIDFYFDYVRTFLSNMDHLSRHTPRFWHSQLMEGWYDSNYWSSCIDALFRRDRNLKLLRKELSMYLPIGQMTMKTTGPDRYDGIFRWFDGTRYFDLGIVEVGRMPDKNDPKPFADQTKIVSALKVLFGHYLEMMGMGQQVPAMKKDGLQLIGILCSGTAIIIYRMAYDPEKEAFIVHTKSFMVEEHRLDFDANLDLMEYLAQCRLVLLRSAEIVRVLMSTAF
ncbi:hypothetical protein DFH27DRAFT_547715 [Peziza echinospora]|nr:hypothetical protein DFH27DRAFT_547715 [Peziza echinospora]